MINDPVGDYLTRIRNSCRAGKSVISAPYSKLKEEITKILKQEGYILGYEVVKEGCKSSIIINAKYINRSSAIVGLKRISRPGLRRFVKAGDIPRVFNDTGISIISTSQGILTGRDAKLNNTGGELLAFVW